MEGKLFDAQGDAFLSDWLHVSYASPSCHIACRCLKRWRENEAWLFASTKIIFAIQQITLHLYVM